MFYYSRDRGGAHVEEHLSRWRGILQADAYSGYNRLYEAGRTPGPILEAACWAFFKTNSFRDGCLLAVNLGDDADTTAAVYGQLAGSYYGASGIPEDWTGKLAMKDAIESFAQRIYELALDLD